MEKESSTFGQREMEELKGIIAIATDTLPADIPFP